MKLLILTNHYDACTTASVFKKLHTLACLRFTKTAPLKPPVAQDRSPSAGAILNQLQTTLETMDIFFQMHQATENGEASGTRT